MNTSKGQPKTGKVAMNTSKGQLTTGTEAMNTSKGQPKTGKEAMSTSKGQPKTGKEAMNTSKGQLKTGKEAMNTSKGQLTTGKVAMNTSKGQPKTEKRAMNRTCNICSVTCHSIHDFQQHLEGAKHTNKCRNHIMCPLCQSSFEEGRYKNHLISKSHMKRLASSKVYRCKPCNKVLRCHASERHNFQAHLQSKKHAENSRNNHLCPTCNEQYPTLTKYKEHLKSKEHLKKIGAVSL